MLAMQDFYNRLYSGQASQDGYWLWLAQLAQASLEQLAALKSEIAWDAW